MYLVNNIINNNSLSYYSKTIIENTTNIQVRLIQQLMACIAQLEANHGNWMVQAGVPV
jgi:hypothetical protein